MSKLQRPSKKLSVFLSLSAYVVATAIGVYAYNQSHRAVGDAVPARLGGWGGYAFHLLLFFRCA